MLHLMVAAILGLTPLSTATFSSDTAQVTLAGNPLVGSIEVVHRDGKVLVNGYLVYPTIPRATSPQPQPLTQLELDHKALLAAFYAVDRSDEEAVAFLQSSALVDSAWIADRSLYFRWKGGRRAQAVYRTPMGVPMATDRSEEYYSLLTGYLQSGMSVYLGEYVVAFPRQQRLLEEEVRRSATRSSASRSNQQKYRRLIDDLRSPRDLNELKER